MGIDLNVRRKMSVGRSHVEHSGQSPPVLKGIVLFSFIGAAVNDFTQFTIGNEREEERQKRGSIVLACQIVCHTI